MPYTPTQEQLDNFWNGLQSTLNEAGADLDLARPEDLFRIRMTHVSNADYKDYSADVTCTMPFASNPDINIAEVSEEELVAMQHPGKPDKEKLTELFIAAREGRLIFNSLPESRVSQRQVVADADGKTSVLPDMNHPTPVILDICTLIDKPEKPDVESAGIGNRIAAFFGSKKAKAICQRVDSDNARHAKEYEQLLERHHKVLKLMEERPDFVQQVLNGNYSATNYLQVPYDNVGHARESRLNRMGNHAHKTAVTAGIKDIINETIQKNADAIAEKMKNSDTITPEIKQSMAEIFYMKALDNHIDTKLDKNKLSEAELRLTSKQAVKGSPAYKKNFSIICGERFNKAMENIKPADLKAFAADPEKAANLAYNKLAAGIGEAPALSTKLHLEQVKVKDTAKEAPDAAFSVKL